MEFLEGLLIILGIALFLNGYKIVAVILVLQYQFVLTVKSVRQSNRQAEFYKEQTRELKRSHLSSKTRGLIADDRESVYRHLFSTNLSASKKYITQHCNRLSTFQEKL